MLCIDAMIIINFNIYIYLMPLIYLSFIIFYIIYIYIYNIFKNEIK